MQNVIIFGAGSSAKILAQELLGQDNGQNPLPGGGNILFFVDNDSKKWHTQLEFRVADKSFTFSVQPPKQILNTQFDKIILATMVGYDDVLAQLKSYGVPMEKIEHIHLRVKLEARINFLKSFAKECKDKSIEGDIAEVGVFQGDFAKHMNALFAAKTLYLFDTFEGFDKRDLDSESREVKEYFSEGHLGDTSIELVMSKMPNPSKVVIKKGYFPQTAAGLENERFCFVNLDPDLYEPILAGLEFFYPRLSRGGVILIHDYFNSAYPGVKRAVDEFCTKHNIFAIPTHRR